MQYPAALEVVSVEIHYVGVIFSSTNVVYNLSIIVPH